MLDLDIVAVDGKDVDFKANPFETIFFENTNPTAESRRTIKLKNSSPIAVPFHWSMNRLIIASFLNKEKSKAMKLLSLKYFLVLTMLSLISNTPT